MNPRHNRLKRDANFVPEEGQRDLLCRNKESLRCPSFGCVPPLKSEEAALEYLASILVDAYFDSLEYDRTHTNKTKESGDLLPGLNERAG